MSESPYYQSIGTGYTAALEKQQAKQKRSKYIVFGSIFALVVLIAIGIGVGVSVAKSHTKPSTKASKSGSSSSSPGNPAQTDPNDPSTFQKDPRFHQSFYGIAYTPEGSQLPNCGSKLADVIADVQIMSQLTTRIRLYGADCNQTQLVLEAIKQTKVNVTVYVANYPIPNDNAPYTRQRDAITAAIQAYGTDHIAGVTVGNEFMLDYLTAQGATDPNGAVGAQGAVLLNADIADTRSTLASMNLKNMPVGNADAGSYFNNAVLKTVDYGMANVHPWFANVSIQQAAAWTADFFSQTDVLVASQLPNKPQMSIAETGWPTQSSDAGNANNGASAASEANLQTFLDTFVCQANANGTGYFFFEFFDEPWKDQQFGGVEGWWGLFHSNRTLKAITLPNCQSP